jgi:hypothetical protein
LRQTRQQRAVNSSRTSGVDVADGEALNTRRGNASASSDGRTSNREVDRVGACTTNEAVASREGVVSRSRRSGAGECVIGSGASEAGAGVETSSKSLTGLRC